MTKRAGTGARPYKNSDFVMMNNVYRIIYFRYATLLELPLPLFNKVSRLEP